MSRGDGTAEAPVTALSGSRCDRPFVVQVHMRLAEPSPRCSLPSTRTPVTRVRVREPRRSCHPLGGRVVVTAEPLISLPLTTGPGWPHRLPARPGAEPASPHRRRAALVPLNDELPVFAPEGGDGDQGERWYLGANGTVAHRPAGQFPASPRPAGLASHAAACGVFLTQVRAGRHVARCEVCASLDAPLDRDGRNDEQRGRGDAMS